MDTEKLGALIKCFRKEKNLTQLELAKKLNISDKTVSKWERGLGAPDVSMLEDVAKALDTGVDILLSGERGKEDFTTGNLKKLRIYVCEECGNLTICTGNTAVFCCGRKLSPKKAFAPDASHDLSIERIEDDWFITSNHEMTKEHYISLVFFVSSDYVFTYKKYPEWNLDTRIPMRGHGVLYWYCNKHELFSKII